MNKEITNKKDIDWNHRSLKGVYVREMGWLLLGHSDIDYIAEHPVNGFVQVFYLDVYGNEEVWVVNPHYIIAKK